MWAAAEGLSRAAGGARAGAEAVAAARRALAPRAADVVVLFAAGYEDPRPLVAAARKAANGARLVGCGAAGVLVGAAEYEDGPAVAALAIAGGAQPFYTDGPAGAASAGRGLATIFADGYSMHPEALARGLSAALPGWAIAGGVATGERAIYPAHRWLDGEIGAGGVAGLRLPGEPLLAVTHACRPLGPAHTVTSANGRVIESLDGRPAFAVFAERARPLLDDLPRAAQVLFLAVIEGDGDGDGDDFTLRGLIGFDPEHGVLASSDPIPEGARVRFALREAGSAREDLGRAVADLARRLEGRPPRLGFYFCCAGRGRGLFGIPDHDVSYIQGVLGRFPLVGFFGGGELGPSRGGLRLHLFSGVLAVLP